MIMKHSPTEKKRTYSCNSKYVLVLNNRQSDDKSRNTNTKTIQISDPLFVTHCNGFPNSLLTNSALNTQVE